MPRSFIISRSAFLGALAACAFATQGLASTQTRIVLFDEIDEGATPLSLPEERYLRFGNIIFDYYSDRRFSALSGLLVNRSLGLFDEDTEYAELLLGELYVGFGLPIQAGEIFERLLRREILSSTRAETWLHKAALHYRKGDLSQVTDILESEKTKGLKPELEARRRLMLAATYMDQDDFESAIEHLSEVPPSSTSHSYATYNLGVAMIRSDQVDDGVRLLNTLIPLANDNEETLAIKDRGALAVGLVELNRDNPAAARDSLLRVRVDGPFSNEALMALGLANYRRGTPAAALPLWNELTTRNPAHESVQEALVLSAQVYEELDAEVQALAGFENAANILANEKQFTEKVMRTISQSGWLETLVSQNQHALNQDPMSYLTSHGTAQGPEAAYLYPLFSSHRFVESFRQFQQLQRMRDIMVRWQTDLPTLIEVHRQRQAQLEANLPEARGLLSRVKRHHDKLQIEVQSLAYEMPTQLDPSRVADIADIPNSVMWQRIEDIDRHLRSATVSDDVKERLRRVRGVLLWDIVHKSPDIREQQLADSRQLSSDSQIAAIRIAATEQIIRDASIALQDGLAGRLQRYEERIQQNIEMSEAAMRHIEQMLEQDALHALEQVRRRIASLLAEAHLGVARVQDASFGARKDGRQAQ